MVLFCRPAQISAVLISLAVNVLVCFQHSVAEHVEPATRQERSRCSALDGSARCPSGTVGRGGLSMLQTRHRSGIINSSAIGETRESEQFEKRRFVSNQTRDDSNHSRLSSADVVVGPIHAPALAATSTVFRSFAESDSRSKIVAASNSPLLVYSTWIPSLIEGSLSPAVKGRLHDTFGGSGGMVHVDVPQLDSKNDSTRQYTLINGSHALLLELHLPNATLSGLQVASQGSLHLFLEKLQTALSEAANMSLDQIKILEMHQSFKRKDLRSTKSQNGFDPSHDQNDEVLVRLALVADAFAQSKSDLRHAVDTLSVALNDTTSDLRSGDMGHVFRDAMLTFSLTADLAARSEKPPGAMTMTTMTVPLVISATFTAVLVWLATI